MNFAFCTIKHQWNEMVAILFLKKAWLLENDAWVGRKELVPFFGMKVTRFKLVCNFPFKTFQRPAWAKFGVQYFKPMHDVDRASFKN